MNDGLRWGTTSAVGCPFLLTVSTPGAVSSPKFFYWLCNDKRSCFTCLVAVAAQPGRAGAIRCRRSTRCSSCPKTPSYIYGYIIQSSIQLAICKLDHCATPALHGEKSSRAFLLASRGHQHGMYILLAAGPLHFKYVKRMPGHDRNPPSGDNCGGRRGHACTRAGGDLGGAAGCTGSQVDC